MTREQVLALTGRSFDAAVAALVLGWSSLGAWTLASPPDDDDWFGLPPGVRAGKPHAPPRFHADAAADYTVLQHVREAWRWDNPKLFAFTDALGDIWNVRAYAGTPFEGALTDPACAPQLSLCRMYEPGDYARAALLALAEERS